MEFTNDQIVALAPDTSSVKAARKLLNVSKWPILGFSPEAIWGHCQGSGKKPYVVRVDVKGPAFKCSCPSRKFPCKHGLALLFLYATNSGDFKSDESPEWVSEWLESRRQRTEKKARKIDNAKRKPVDAEARAKRLEKRRLNIQTGFNDLELWICDMLRQGLASLQQKKDDYWETMAARLVDLQASGLASMIKRMRLAVKTESNWPAEVVRIIGNMVLLKCGFDRFEQLPPGLQGDLRTMVGWAISADEVFTQNEVVSDQFFILGTSITINENLKEQRIWMQQSNTSKMALFLNFAYGNQGLENSIPTGTRIESDIVYFPSSSPLRALEKNRKRTDIGHAPSTGHETLNSALEDIVTVLSSIPWMTRWPLLLENVTPLFIKGRFLILDSCHQALKIHPAFKQPWDLISMSGGYPIRIFCEWVNGSLLPLSCWSDHEFLGFYGEINSEIL